VRSALGECLDVINHRAEVVEKRGLIAAPSGIVVREWSLVPTLTSESIEKLQGWSKDNGAVAPPTEPLVASKDANLKIVGEGPPRSSGACHQLSLTGAVKVAARDRDPPCTFA
jgi:hypothetical protein